MLLTNMDIATLGSYVLCYRHPTKRKKDEPPLPLFFALSKRASTNKTRTTRVYRMQDSMEGRKVPLAIHADSLAWRGSDSLAVATSSLTGELWDGELVLLQAGKASVQARLPVRAGLSSLAWVGDTLAAAGDDCAIYLASAAAQAEASKVGSKAEQEQEEQAAELPRLKGHDRLVSAVAATADALFSGSWDKT